MIDAYTMQNRVAFVELVEANLPPSEHITDEDCADGVLPSIALITLQISAELSSPRLSARTLARGGF